MAAQRQFAARQIPYVAGTRPVPGSPPRDGFGRTRLSRRRGSNGGRALSITIPARAWVLPLIEHERQLPELAEPAATPPSSPQLRRVALTALRQPTMRPLGAALPERRPSPPNRTGRSPEDRQRLSKWT
jgi:hypothetical protein